MLCAAARETGGLAIQNRGTLGGNIVNASPATDTPPALLAYGAEVELSGRKSFVTSAHHADSYVWSSKPTAGSEATTLHRDLGRE